MFFLPFPNVFYAVTFVKSIQPQSKALLNSQTPQEPSDSVHPTLFDKITTEQMIKMLKFRLWSEYQMQTNNGSMKDLIDKEVAKYNPYFATRSDYKVC
jgi:hypothetical protein